MTGSAYQAQLVAQLRAAEDELARRRQAAEQIRVLHYPEGSMWGDLQCYLCGGPNYPCDTVKALNGPGDHVSGVVNVIKVPEQTGNAEDCLQCRDRRDLPYPFLCTGHPAEARP